MKAVNPPNTDVNGDSETPICFRIDRPLLDQVGKLLLVEASVLLRTLCIGEVDDELSIRCRDVVLKAPDDHPQGRAWVSEESSYPAQDDTYYNVDPLVLRTKPRTSLVGIYNSDDEIVGCTAWVWQPKLRTWRPAEAADYDRALDFLTALDLILLAQGPL